MEDKVKILIPNKEIADKILVKVVEIYENLKKNVLPAVLPIDLESPEGNEN